MLCLKNISPLGLLLVLLCAGCRHDMQDQPRFKKPVGIHWLQAAAPLPAYIGFAVGRTSFWDALSGLRDKKITREQAVADIAGRYHKWVTTFEEARKAG